MSDEMVYKVMSSDIIAIGENATMKRALELMRFHNIRHLPVTNTEGRIVGILSDRDVQRAQKSMTINDFEQTTGSGENHLVKYYMNHPVLEAKASDSIGTVVKRMMNGKVSCFLIVDEFTAPCGIVTTDDMLKHLVDIIEKRDLEINSPIGTIFQYLKMPTYE